MRNEITATEQFDHDSIDGGVLTSVQMNKTNNQALPDNPVIQRALRRLKDSQEKENHVSHYTKHGSHASHSKGNLWL